MNNTQVKYLLLVKYSKLRESFIINKVDFWLNCNFDRYFFKFVELIPIF